jgi:hypothetical protein
MLSYFNLFESTYELLRPYLLIAEPNLINELLVENFGSFSSHRVCHRVRKLTVFDDFDSLLIFLNLCHYFLKE